MKPCGHIYDKKGIFWANIVWLVDITFKFMVSTLFSGLKSAYSGTKSKENLAKWGIDWTFSDHTALNTTFWFFRFRERFLEKNI